MDNQEKTELELAQLDAEIEKIDIEIAILKTKRDKLIFTRNHDRINKKFNSIVGNSEYCKYLTNYKSKYHGSPNDYRPDEDYDYYFYFENFKLHFCYSLRHCHEDENLSFDIIINNIVYNNNVNDNNESNDIENIKSFDEQEINIIEEIDSFDEQEIRQKIKQFEKNEIAYKIVNAIIDNFVNLKKNDTVYEDSVINIFRNC